MFLALGLVLVCGCSKPFTAPPKSVTTVAVLPPSNRTGDPLLVAGGSFLEQYAFKTERVTVPEVLLAETRSFLEKRGYAVVAGETVAAATDGHAPRERRGRRAHRHPAQGRRCALHRDPSLGLGSIRSTPQAIIVSIEASLVDPSGRVVWQADRPAKPLQTRGRDQPGDGLHDRRAEDRRRALRVVGDELTPADLG